MSKYTERLTMSITKEQMRMIKKESALFKEPMSKILRDAIYRGLEERRHFYANEENNFVRKNLPS